MDRICCFYCCRGRGDNRCRKHRRQVQDLQLLMAGCGLPHSQMESLDFQVDLLFGCLRCWLVLLQKVEEVGSKSVMLVCVEIFVKCFDIV